MSKKSKKDKKKTFGVWPFPVAAVQIECAGSQPMKLEKHGCAPGCGNSSCRDRDYDEENDETYKVLDSKKRILEKMHEGFIFLVGIDRCEMTSTGDHQFGDSVECYGRRSVLDKLLANGECKVSQCMFPGYAPRNYYHAADNAIVAFYEMRVVWLRTNPNPDA